MERWTHTKAPIYQQQMHLIQAPLSAARWRRDLLSETAKLLLIKWENNFLWTLRGRWVVVLWVWNTCTAQMYICLHVIVLVIHHCIGVSCVCDCSWLSGRAWGRLRLRAGGCNQEKVLFTVIPNSRRRGGTRPVGLQRVRHGNMLTACRFGCFVISAPLRLRVLSCSSGCDSLDWCLRCFTWNLLGPLVQFEGQSH